MSNIACVVHAHLYPHRKGNAAHEVLSASIVNVAACHPQRASLECVRSGSVHDLR